MRRRYERLYSPALGREVQLLVFGHYGAPLIAFPTGGGRFYDFEENGMIGAVAPLIGAGRLKVYCPESLDAEGWLAHTDPHERALRAGAYENFVVDTLLPFIRADCHDGSITAALTGCSIGAFHAANFALKHPHLFPYALCLSGRYDLGGIVGSSSSPEVYFNNPVAYVSNFEGAHLEFVRRSALWSWSADRGRGRSGACARRTGWPTCSWRRACRTSATSGGVMSSTTGAGGGGSWRIIWNAH